LIVVILAMALRANPGIGSRDFESIANKSGVPYNQVRRFLFDGIASGKINICSVGPKKEHRLAEKRDETDTPTGPV
jgi:hypothetical protein